MIQIQVEKAPAVADGPIEHLIACHRRIEQRLDTLKRAGAMLDQDPQASLTAIANSLRFMDISGVLHTVDEEQSVFPRIRQTASTEEIAYLDRLEGGHLRADEVYSRLKEIAASLLDNVTPELAGQYRELVEELDSAYRSHIESEDTILVNMGRRLLSTAELETIQAEMRARRR